MLDALSIFDWITPLWNISKDLHHVLTDGEPTWTIWLDSGDLRQASRALKRAGIDVISKTQAVFGGGEAGLDVRQSQLDDALDTLAGCGITTW